MLAMIRNSTCDPAWLLLFSYQLLIRFEMCQILFIIVQTSMTTITAWVSGLTKHKRRALKKEMQFKNDYVLRPSINHLHI